MKLMFSKNTIKEINIENTKYHLSKKLFPYLSKTVLVVFTLPAIFIYVKLFNFKLPLSKSKTLCM